MTGETVARAEAAWDGAAPDWVVALAAACERETQRAVAARIGFSHSVVGMVIRNAYGKSTERVEAAVKGALMAATVECPVLEEIPTSACVAHQRRKARALGANPEWVRLYRACRECKHSMIKGARDAE